VRRGIARGSGILLAGSVLSKVLRLASDLLVGRVLGPAGFGVIAASMSFVGILGEVAILGTQRAALRFSSLAGGGSGRLVRRAMLVPISFGGVLVLAVVLARAPLTELLFGKSVSPWLLPAFAIAIPAIGIFSILQFAARAQKRFVADTVIGDVCRMGLPLAGTAIFFAVNPTVWGATWGFVTGTLATVLVGVAFAGRKVETPSKERLRDLMKVALPLSLGSFSILLMSELDKVMLAAFRSEEEVGIYNAAFRIARQILIVMPALNAAMSPYVAPLLAEGRREDLSRLYRRTVRWSLATGWSAALLFCAFASDFLGLFGKDFQAGKHILMVVCMGHLVNAAAGTVAVIIQYSGHEKKELWNGLLVIGANAGLNLVLIPRFGALGAAYSSFLSLTLVNALRMAQAWKILDTFPYDRKTFGVLGAGIVGLGLGWGVRAICAALGLEGPMFGAMGAVCGMGLGWVLYFVIVGASMEEAAFLRLPKTLIRIRPSKGLSELACAPRSRPPECDTTSPHLRRSASKETLPRRS
jgi:O-antigen/teichoic acid export membrane protein